MQKTLISALIILISIFKTEAQTSVLNVADSLYVNGNYTKAIETYKTYNNTAEVYDKIARAYIAIGNYDKALLNYKRATETNLDNALIKFEYARLLSKTKHFKEASTLFNDLVYIDYKNPNYHYELGLVLEQLNDSTAMNRFRSAYDLDQTHQKAIYKIAKYFVQKRMPEAAEKYISKGLESYENNVELVNLRALNYYYRQDYKNSIIWFEKLIALGEATDFVHEKLSISYAEEYEYEKAIEQRKLALKYNPFDATAMYVIGSYYEILKDYENAEKYIKQFLLLSDKPLDAEYTKLGIVFNYQKKYKEAIETLKIAIKEDPSNEMAGFFLARTQEVYFADYDAKIMAYEKFKDKFPASAYNKLIDMRIVELKEEQFLGKE